MNVVRILPLFVLVATLSACAAKPARDSAPSVGTVVPATEAPVADAAPAPVVDDASASADAAPVAGSPAPAAATPPTVDADGDGTPDATEDDFTALYGSEGVSGGSAAAYDPWEPLNRRVHRFNVVVDNAIARPLATAYTNVVPRFARTGVSNFFSNLRAPVTITNQLLQGRGADAWTASAAS